MKKLLILLLLLAVPAYGQVNVALSPVSKQQFFSTAGAPLVSGCLNTYITGTSTPLATYVDSTGATQNANPIILDGGGFANIWLSNAAYRFVLVAYDGIPGNKCAAGITQYTIDGINAFAPISTGANIFLLGQASDPAGTGGELIYRNDIPCIRAFTTLWDCIVRLTDTQTLTNKTLTTPTITGPTITGTIAGNPTISGGTYQGTVTAAYTATSGAPLPNLNGPVKITGSPPVLVATSAGDTGGAIGICVSGCASPGATAQVQSIGIAPCVVDNAFTAGDYVQISAINTGGCHDSGVTFPITGQVLGRIDSTSGSGTANITLFPPEIKALAGASPGCTTFTPITVTNNNTTQNLQSCTIAANTLVQGSLLQVDATGYNGTGSAMTISIGVSIGGGQTCTSTSGTTSNSSTQPWNVAAKLFILTAGAGGTANWACEYFSSTAGGSVGNNTGAPGATFALNTTVTNSIQITVLMSVANASNTVVEQGLKAVIF